jgi:hypothetical protein
MGGSVMASRCNITSRLATHRNRFESVNRFQSMFVSEHRSGVPNRAATIKKAATRIGAALRFLAEIDGGAWPVSG